MKRNEKNIAVLVQMPSNTVRKGKQYVAQNPAAITCSYLKEKRSKYLKRKA